VAQVVDDGGYFGGGDVFEFPVTPAAKDDRRGAGKVQGPHGLAGLAVACLAQQAFAGGYGGRPVQ
jgi:hypothetical protein